MGWVMVTCGLLKSAAAVELTQVLSHWPGVVVRKIQLDTASLYRGGPAFAAIAVAEKIQFFTAIAVKHRCNLHSKIYN